MKPTRRATIASSLCLASALTIPGCATDRTTQAPSGWTRLWAPFRVAQKPDAEPENVLGAPEFSLAPPTPPDSHFTPSDAADGYYRPRSSQLSAPLIPARPPAAPPAVEPGFLNDDATGNAQNTSGQKPQEGRPARLRDVFDNFGRKAPPPARRRIPLDEPVAHHQPPSVTHVVSYEQSQPVALGRPEFTESRGERVNE